MKELLTEVYRTTKKLTGIDPSRPGNMKQVLVDDAAFASYVTGLAESIENKRDRETFLALAENTRLNLLENSMFQINPYETLTLPILRVFYPKLVAKAHFALLERERRLREEAARREALKLEDLILQQPNDFAD